MSDHIWKCLLLCAMFLVGCSSLICDVEIVQEATSPDGQWKATLFVENCGATSSTTGVALGDKESTLRVARRDGLLYATRGKWKPYLHWEAPRTLIIRTGVEERYVLNRADRWNGVNVAYEPNSK